MYLPHSSILNYRYLLPIVIFVAAIALAESTFAHQAVVAYSLKEKQTIQTIESLLGEAKAALQISTKHSSVPKLLQEAIELAEEADNFELLASAYELLSVYYEDVLHDKVSSRNEAFKALHYYNNCEPSDTIHSKVSAMYARIAALHYQENQIENAQRFIDSSIRRKENVKNKAMIMQLNFRILTYYQLSNNIPIALKILEEQKLLLPQVRDSLYEILILVLFKEEEIHTKTKNFQKALLKNDSILTLLQKNQNLPDKWIWHLNRRGDLLTKSNRLEEAYQVYKRAYNYSLIISDPKIKAICAYNIASILFDLQNFELCDHYNQILLKISLENRFLQDIVKSYKLSSEMAKKIPDMVLAFKYLSLASQYQDSLTDSYKSLNMNVFTVEKEQNDFRDLYYKYILQNKNDKKIINKLNNELFWAFCLAGLLIVLSGVLVFLLLRMNKVQKSLNQHSYELKAKNKEIETMVEELQSNNDELHSTIDRLHQSHTERTNLLAIVTHDLKAPINRALGIAQILEMEKHTYPPTHQELLSKLTKELLHERMLIADILEAERLENEYLDDPTQPTNISDLLMQSISRIEDDFKAKNILLKTDIKFGIVVKAINSYFIRVVDNLLSNALKFSREYSTIIIKLSKTDNQQALVEISDGGPGFTKDDLKHVFKKYVKLSAKPTGDETSTGLGLAIVRLLMYKMKGKLELKTKIGYGSTFRLYFDLAEEAS